MKLYSSPRAPNPRRVHVFLAEKGVEVPVHIVDLGQAQQFTPEFLALNPDAVVPTLVLDDGRAIGESLAICRYFEALHPQPPLFGSDPEEVGLVEMWVRMFEHQLYLPVQDAYRNSSSIFADRALPGVRDGVPAIPELVRRADGTVRRFLTRLDRQLTGREFVLGDHLTMPDIMGVVTLDFARRTKMEALADLSAWPSVSTWHAAVSERPAFAKH